MKLNDMLYDLLSLAKEESEPNRYANSEEYDRLFNELDSKTLIIDELEEKLGCPLDVFIKLLFEQKIWIEVDDEMYLTENIDFSIELELQEDETWINTLEDYGEAEFWAWYIYNKNYTDHYTDHVVLRLKDYKKTWWLKKDKSE